MVFEIADYPEGWRDSVGTKKKDVESQIVPADLNDRRGRFTIAHNDIRRNPDVVIAMLAGIIPVRVESVFDLSAIEYTAIGAGFRVVKRGAAVPWYVGEFETVTDDDGATETIFKGWSECS